MSTPMEDPELEDKDKGTPPALDEDDIKLLKTYGVGPYAQTIKGLEEDVKELSKKVSGSVGGREIANGGRMADRIVWFRSVPFGLVSSQVNELRGIKESDTGLAQPSQWDLVADKQAMQEEQPLQVRTSPPKELRPTASSSRADESMNE